ncbi:hypothetical protein AAFP30_22835 [Gordonia sp. CPCC 205515]|uniref:hypothetical protein n=1 Tax=Gordonia sp. CPCC 205515 TaxID=3140791 RepID=UPI003AF3E947
MSGHRSIRRHLIGLTAATAIAAGTLAAATAGTAGAAPTGDRVYPLSSCFGLSPNIVDTPYNPTRAMVSQYDGTTYIATEYSSLWLGVGYSSSARLNWHNLRTNKRGTIVSNTSVKPPYSGIHYFTAPTRTIGPGPVRVTLSSVNRNALWAIPAQTCSATISVP